ncbi:MAG: hypothetical protein E7252_05755 [Lachnospira sp.]|nr:hypothetical protein [Lachnospira sp.]
MKKILNLCVGISLLVCIAYLFYGHVYVALIFSPLMIPFLKYCEKERQRKEEELLAEQFKEGMLAVAASLNVGYSIENAFKEATVELKLLYGDHSAIVKAFRNIINKVNMNINVETALMDFALQSNNEDILIFAEIFKYAKRSGGDMIAIIKNSANIITEKIETQKEIAVLVAAKKYEHNIMSIVPMGIIVYMRFSNPTMFNGMYDNISGIIVMTVCLIIYIIGYLLGKKIVRIGV